MIHHIEICSHPVFIIGSPRSGTTALGKALGRHSQLWASEESFILSSLFGDGRVEREYQRWAARGSSWLSVQHVDQREFLRYVGLGLNALFTSRSSGKRWIDHTPHYGFMVDALADMFPGAYFLHILRDGRAVVNSMMNLQNRVKEHVRAEMLAGNYLPEWTRDVRKACEAWRESVEAGMAAVEKHPDRCLTVRHAELTASPEVEFTRIFQFMDLPFERGPIDFWRSTKINSSFLQDSSDSAVTRDHAPWMNWSPEWRDAFREEAAATMVACGLGSADEWNELETVPSQSGSRL